MGSPEVRGVNKNFGGGRNGWESITAPVGEAQAEFLKRNLVDVLKGLESATSDYNTAGLKSPDSKFNGAFNKVEQAKKLLAEAQAELGK